VSSRDWVRYAITRPFVDEPGGRMLYSTGSSHLLSAILTRATGSSTLAYARARLMGPLGIELAGWTRDPQGVYFGGNEMRMRPRDMLTFGELYRNGGLHEGVQVVPAGWIRESWTPRTSSPYNGHRYGLGWWMRTARGHDVHFAWGYGGQYIFVVPDLRLTVVTTSDPVAPREGSHNRSLHRLIDELLIPAAEQGASAAPPGPT
jgi:CubicO group peptidase (beta-lactamase class C family)